MTVLVGRRWRYLTAAAAICLLIWYVGPGDLLTTLGKVQPAPVIVYLLASGLIPFLFGLQIHVALRISGRPSVARTTIAAAVAAWSVGTLTPARAGDLSLAYFANGAIDAGDALAVVVADKLVSLAVLASLACLGTLFVSVPYGRLLALGAGLVFAGSLVALALARPLWIDTVVRRAGGKMLGARAIYAWDCLRAMVAVPGFLAWCAAATTMRWIYVCAINLIIFRAVAQAPGLAHVITATSVGRLLSIVPVTIGGVGVKEPAQIIIYREAGVPAEAVLAVSLLGMACLFLIAAVAPLLVGMPRRLLPKDT